MDKFFKIVLKKVKTKVLIRVFLFTLILFIALIFTNCESQDNIIYKIEDNNTKIIIIEDNKTNTIDNNKTVSCCFKKCFVS
jgi:energy-coupling factor transporter transmembrane protein EcfT